MSEYLSPGELHALTGYARATAQAEWLALKGIPYMLDGRRVIASREHVRARIEGRVVASSRGMNMAAIK